MKEHLPEYLLSKQASVDIAGMSIILTDSRLDWKEWNEFIQEYKDDGLLVRGLDPFFYVVKVLELAQAVFSPRF